MVTNKMAQNVEIALSWGCLGSGGWTQATVSSSFTNLSLKISVSEQVSSSLGPLESFVAMSSRRSTESAREYNPSSLPSTTPSLLHNTSCNQAQPVAMSVQPRVQVHQAIMSLYEVPAVSKLIKKYKTGIYCSITLICVMGHKGIELVLYYI